MQKLMGDEGWGGGLFFSTDPKCLCHYTLYVGGTVSVLIRKCLSLGVEEELIEARGCFAKFRKCLEHTIWEIRE